MSKIEIHCIGGSYCISRTDMHGEYCPDTGEYYLARNGGNPFQDVVLATLWHDIHDCCHVYSARGYSYQVVRELLQLGHLTPKTLEQFRQDGGEVWWEQ